MIPLRTAPPDAPGPGQDLAPASEPPPASELKLHSCGAPAGSCLWPPGDRVQALLPGGLQAARPVLWGDLADMHAGDLLSLLCHQRRTGLLVASCEGVERALAFIEGSLVWGRSEVPQEGEVCAEVVHGLLQGCAGTFSFLRTAAEALPQGERLETQGLILEGLRRIDEGRR